MKRFLYITAAILLTSCASIRVSTDYDTSVDFSSYNAFAFFNPGIDDAKISDLDKRRILKALDNTLTEKDISQHQIIINCSPVGTFPNVEDAPNLPYNGITSKHILFDLIYNP